MSTSYNKTQMLNCSLFDSEEPNGGRHENCVMWTPKADGTLNDYECGPKAVNDIQCFCLFDQSVLLRLRGLCPASHLDSFYTIKNEGDRIFLKGPSGTEISLEDGEWKATTTKDQKMTRSKSILASPGSYLLGKHDWIISKDSKVCSQDSLAATTVSAYTYRTSLKLSSCEDNEFTCWDGDCINIGERCDQVFDCSDQSDERDCQMLVLEDSYKRSVPPLISAIAENGTKLIIPAEVVVSLKLIELLGIKERENQIEVKIETKLKWYDYRAKSFNLKKEMLLNTMQLKDVERMWIPRIIYSNMKGGENTKETIDDAIMYVEREGAPAFSGLEILRYSVVT